MQGASDKRVEFLAQELFLQEAPADESWTLGFNERVHGRNTVVQITEDMKDVYRQKAERIIAEGDALIAVK